MARRSNNQWWSMGKEKADRIGRRPPLASAGGPAGRPTGKHRATKPKRKRRR